MGHSGGGHSCISVAQLSPIRFSCVVAASGVLSPNKREKVQFGKNASGVYNPAANAKRTKADRVIVVGDPVGDKTVHKIGWEDYVVQAKKAKQNIQYIKVSKVGHRTENKGMDSMNKCLAEM